jgi:hypothetical protein
MTINNSQPNLSNSQIKKLTLIALISSLVIGLIAVLPAGYGKDITGLGKLLGFTRLYQDHKEVDAKIAEKTATNSPIFKEITLTNVGSGPDTKKPQEANNPAPETQYETRTDSVKITIPADKGLEYKIAVLKYGQVKYAWKTNGETLFFDLHGDVKTNQPNTDYFESYSVAYANNMAGSFIAPFEGKHGWYFKNKSENDVEVTLHLIGNYQIISNK